MIVCSPFGGHIFFRLIIGFSKEWTNPFDGRCEEKMEIWIYFVIAGIIVSGFMAVRAARQEKQIEDKWIEQEGEKFIARMNEEKEKRKQISTGA
jgi:Sporulation protein YhaL